MDRSAAVGLRPGIAQRFRPTELIWRTVIRHRSHGARHEPTYVHTSGRRDRRQPRRLATSVGGAQAARRLLIAALETWDYAQAAPMDEIFSLRATPRARPSCAPRLRRSRTAMRIPILPIMIWSLIGPGG